MSKIVFFCRCEKSILKTVEFYKQDIDALNILGHEVIICTKYYEIPLKFDAIFIWWWTYALYPVILSRILRKPSIITGTYNFQYPKDFKGIDYFRRPLWQRILIKYATKLSSLNLYVNRIEMEACINYFNLRNSRFYPHSIDDDYLKGPSNFREKVLFNIAWSEENNLIRKGIPELLKAIHLLNVEGFNVHLKLAGHTGNGVDFLLNMIRQLKIENQVSYLGMISREEKIKLLRTCEVYVQPSYYEGFGVAIAEAMGCGACVIVCDVGAVKEVVGKSGIYVTPGSSIEIADAIKQILMDDKQRNALQKSAVKKITDSFQFSKKLERLRGYLLELGIR